MRTDKELIAASKAYTDEDRRLSWFHLLTTTAVLAALVVIACSDLWWPIRLPFSVAAGLTLVRFFVLYHDHQHGSILKGSLVADVVMRAFGLTMLNPPSVWKRSHDHHHFSNSRSFGVNVGSYPLKSVEGYRRSSAWERFTYGVSRHPLTIGLGYVTVFFLGMCVLPVLANPRKHFDAGIALALHAAVLTGLWWRGVDELILGGLLPFVLGSGAGAYLFFAQHNFPGVKLYVDGDWSYAKAALDSSSYTVMGPVMRWFTGNIGYHHVHHLNHHIPFYRLPEAMQGMPELQSPRTTTLHPRDVAACLRLKLWDEDAGELVPWPKHDDRAQAVDAAPETAVTPDVIPATTEASPHRRAA